MISLVVTRDLVSGSPADLTITDNPATSGIWVPEDGLSRPGMSWRRTYADPSPFYAGQLLVGAVLEATSVQVTLYAKDTTTSALKAKQAALEAAFSQFTYVLTIVEDGASESWNAEPASWSWGELDSGMVRAKISRGTFDVPLYPVSA